MNSYYNNGNLVTLPSLSRMPQAYLFSDVTLKNWLTKNRGITFVSANPFWAGPPNQGSIFYYAGSTNNVNVSGLKVFVDKNTGAEGYIPMVFSFRAGEKDNHTITRAIEQNPTSDDYAVPSGLTFTNIDLDGTLMGWCGGVQNTTISHIRSHRYSDLQDANGGNVGGIGKWFPPPHLFYLNQNTNLDDGLLNHNLTITDVIDYGNRIGVARDKGGSDTVSGDARSLKIGGINVLVDGYTTYRPDGVFDLLTSNGITIRNLNGTFDSSFVNYVLPAIRLPGPFGTNLTHYNGVNLYHKSN